MGRLLSCVLLQVIVLYLDFALEAWEGEEEGKDCW